KPPVLRDGVAQTLANYSDPVPQALALTAIVIAFAMTAVAVVVAMREHADLRPDHVDGEEPDDQRRGPR
ncbi:NADH-quinone oxidoreductase subunit K, partial [Bacillus sp. SIMBA_005]|uniref:NADH-quinone oxidoreductase subunit K n=1 Tax=Bacillus sp. SIMBA_005 TaxID=3085754 RepID=UPI00397C355B